MVPESFEKYSATEKGYLKGLKVDIDTIFVPGPCSNTIRYKCRKEAIEVEKEEERPNVISEELGRGQLWTYTTTQTSSSTRNNLNVIRLAQRITTLK
jgi:hypothetical protein